MELSTVHKAVTRAQEKTKELILINASYKINPEIKEVAELICRQNGITLSEYVRQCIECLVNDYTGLDQ